MPQLRFTRSFAFLGASLALAACKEGGAPQCINPADPLCVTVADVEVTVLTAEEDTVVQVGSTAQLAATATDNLGGNVTTLPIAWVSTSSGTATVTPSGGLLTAVAPGTTTVQATVDGVAGGQAMVVVNAPLGQITDAVTDTLAVLLRQALTNTPRGQIATGMQTCATRLAAGNIVALDGCLTNLRDVSGGSDGNDNSLLNVLDVFFLRASSLLPL